MFPLGRFKARVSALARLFPRGSVVRKGARKAGPLERITLRSMKFSSSRILPGQSHFVRAFMTSGGIDSIFLSIRRACFVTK